jgi:hypothetical protein
MVDLPFSIPLTIGVKAGQQFDAPVVNGLGATIDPAVLAGIDFNRFLFKNILTNGGGNQKSINTVPTKQTLDIDAIQRYTEQEIANIVRNNEINPLKQVLDNDPNYDPLNNQGQQAIGIQGFGVRKGRGFKEVMKERSDITNRAIAQPFIDANNSVKRAGQNVGNSISKFFGGEIMCPQNHAPVMAKDGKMYGNRCKAQAGGGADENYKVDGMGFMNRKIKIGKGIAVEEQPRYKTFGKYIIHMPYLENDNVLNVKFQSMGSIPSIKPVSIDDNFKEFILDIMNTGSVNQKHYNSLTEAEKSHFHKIVKGAGLSNTLKFKQDDKIDDKKDVKRLDVLVGQITAGNDNDKVLKEAKELIRKCVSNGSITKYRGMDLLFQIE